MLGHTNTSHHTTSAMPTVTRNSVRITRDLCQRIFTWAHLSNNALARYARNCTCVKCGQRRGVSRIIRPVPSLMTQTRNSRGLSLEKVAAAVGTDQTNLSRVERGTQIPRRELARALFEFYGGVIPLAAIYDPEYEAPAFTPQPAKKRSRR